MKVVGNRNSFKIDQLVSKKPKLCQYFRLRKSSYFRKTDKKPTKTTLKWVHIVVSNAKRTFLRIYDKIREKYLQQHLDELCYKLNRRYFGNKLFNRLVLAMATMY
jgi:hypothetical protein